LLLALAPAESLAVRLAFSSRADADTVSIHFDSGQAPKVLVRRTGAREISVLVPQAAWQAEKKPGAASFSSQIVASAAPVGDGIRIALRTEAFGYISIPGEDGVQIQVFRDPIGAKWAAQRDDSKSKEQQDKARAEQARKAKEKAQEKAREDKARRGQAQKAKEEAKKKKQEAEAAREREAEAQKAEAAAQAKPEAQKPPPAAAGQPAAGPLSRDLPREEPGPLAAAPLQGGVQSFFSVPYSIRTRVSEGGAGKAVRIAPSELAGQDLKSGELRFRVGRKAPEEVRFAEASGGAPAEPGQAALRKPAAPPPAELGKAPPVQPEPAPPVPAAPEPAKPVAEPPGAVPKPPVAENASAKAEAQPETNATAQAPEEPKAPASREKVFEDVIFEARLQAGAGNFKAAIDKLKALLREPDLTPPLREEAMYVLADSVKGLHSADPVLHFEEIADAYQKAMNVNPKSKQTPRALISLGQLHLKAGNIPEAKAYFKLLMTKYPKDISVPLVPYTWGEYYYRRGDYVKAAEQFQQLIQNYPEADSNLLKGASFALTDALKRNGKYDQAFQIVDYIDKRWPQHYMENPQFLRMAADIEDRLGKLNQAKDHYWTYYNLDPAGEGADIVLARLGDIYLKEGKKKAAGEIYQRVIRDFPDKEGGLVAKMRLAEDGIHDEPNLTEMVSVFDAPYSQKPEDIYREIIEKYPNSPLVPVARLKLAMWLAHKKRFSEALALAQDLIEKNPKSTLAARAKELADNIFAQAVPQLVAEEGYGRVVGYWETYRPGSGGQGVSDDLKILVALSYWKKGQPDKAMELISKYLGQQPVPGVSEKALDLAVNVLLDQQAWNRLSALVSRVGKAWPLQPRQQRQLEYARAIALENLGDSAETAALWARLAADTELDPAFRGYAMYYMAKDAMKRQDLMRAFVYAQEALGMLIQTRGDKEKIKECVLISIYSTERAGRFEEALKWAQAYDRYVPESDPEWAAARFKLAQIYRKAGRVKEWSALLQDIIRKKPGTLYARLAASASETQALEQKLQEFTPAQ
jgi:tetratricopeptide (TPR) repeat protein